MIVCDQQLPVLNGWETLASSREIQPDAVRIMLTGYADLDEAIGAVNEGRVSSFLLKPWNTETLRAVIAEAIETHRQCLERMRDAETIRRQNDELRIWSSDLESIAHERAEAMMNAHDETLNALVMALDTREHETSGHSRRVSVMSLYTALLMGMDYDDIESIYRGALLHDIGKIGIADAILLKPARLDPIERRAIEQHPLIGERFIESIGYLKPARAVVRSHHEKFDGSGYPDGLAGSDIPIGARIFAVIDVYDALRSERPYKSAMTYEDSCKIIRESSGTHFDPDVAELFLSIPRATIEQLCSASISADTFSKALVFCGRFLHGRSPGESLRAA